MVDNELLYLYLEIKNDWAFIFLYEKYKNLLFYLSKRIFNKFFLLPLEYQDLLSIIYFAFYKTVLSYQSNKNKNFKNYLINILKWEVIKYLKKFASKKHQIVSFSLNYEDYLIYNINDQKYNFSWEISDFDLTTYEKDVLQLKYQGFANHEIMVKLNLSYKQVDNAFHRANCKIKKVLNS